MFMFKVGRNYRIMFKIDDDLIFEVNSSQMYKSYYRGYSHSVIHTYLLEDSKLAIQNHSRRRLDIFDIKNNRFEIPGLKSEISIKNKVLKEREDKAYFEFPSVICYSDDEGYDNVETYIYTYEIKEKKIDSDDVKPLVTPVTLEGTTYKYQSSSYYVSWPDNTLFDAAHTHSDGIKFTNRKLPIIKAALYKVDKNDLNATSPNTLSGAEFTLWKYNLINGVFSKDQTWPADGKELIEDPPDSGVFSLGDLTEGYYKIEETLFPAGYVQSDEVPMLYVKMGDNGEMEAVLVRASSPNIGREMGNLTDIVKIGNETVSGNKIWTVTLGNECGTELPSAGGSGIDFFYFVGCILTMLAGASLVMKKNMRSGD